MLKVFETYAKRKGFKVGSLRFLLDGERIEPDKTPKLLHMADNDQIDCMIEQVCLLTNYWKMKSRSDFIYFMLFVFAFDDIDIDV